MIEEIDPMLDPQNAWAIIVELLNEKARGAWTLYEWITDGLTYQAVFSMSDPHSSPDWARVDYESKRLASHVNNSAKYFRRIKVNNKLFFHLCPQAPQNKILKSQSTNVWGQ